MRAWAVVGFEKVTEIVTCKRGRSIMVACALTSPPIPTGEPPLLGVVRQVLTLCVLSPQ